MAECIGSSSEEQKEGCPVLCANESKGLVILSSSLADSELHRLLTMQQLKIKGLEKNPESVLLIPIIVIM